MVAVVEQVVSTTIQQYLLLKVQVIRSLLVLVVLEPHRLL
jgi:hypothetical protein